MGKTITYVYKIWNKNTQCYILGGREFSSPQSAYNQWSWNFATSPAKAGEKPGGGWYANFEMHKIRKTVTETFVKTMDVKTKKQEKLEEEIVNFIKKCEAP